MRCKKNIGYSDGDNVKAPTSTKYDQREELK